MQILGSNHGTISFMNYDSKAFTIESYRNVKNLVIYGIDSIDLVNEESPHDEVRANLERLTAITFNFLMNDEYDEDDDDADGECFLLLDEIEKMKSILMYRYQSVLSLEAYKEYMNQLYFLEGEVNKKLSFINYRKAFSYQQSSGRGK